MATLVHTYTTKNFGATVETVDDKKVLKIINEPYFRTELLKFKDGEKLSVAITNKKPKRTEAQNRYLWGVYYPEIAKQTGHSIEEIHEWAKGKFLTDRIIEVLGDKVRIKKSTTELSVVEFGEYIMRIESETGVQAPPTDGYYD